MKMLKYSLFLGVASTLIYGSSLFAGKDLLDSPGSMQMFVDRENLDPNAELEQSSLVDLKSKDVEQSAKNQEVLVSPLGDVNHQELVSEKKPIIVEPTIIDSRTPPPTLDAELRAEDAIQIKVEELKEEKAKKEAMLKEQESLLHSSELVHEASVPAGLFEEQAVVVKPAKKVKKAKLTQEEIDALRNARAAKKQAAMEQAEVMPFSEEELAGEFLAAENEGVNDVAIVPSAQKVEQEYMLAEIAAPEEQVLLAPVKKKKTSKKTKLTPEQIAAIKAGGAEKEAVIAELKVAGEEKRKARVAKKEAIKAAEEVVLLEHQDELAVIEAEEEVIQQQEKASTAVIQSDDSRKPYAILYFTPDGAVNLSETIKKGEDFNNKGLPSEVVVLDPINRQVNNDSGAIIVEHTVDGPEVDLAKKEHKSDATMHHDTPPVEHHHQDEGTNPLTALLQ